MSFLLESDRDRVCLTNLLQSPTEDFFYLIIGCTHIHLNAYQTKKKKSNRNARRVRTLETSECRKPVRRTKTTHALKDDQPVDQLGWEAS